MVRSLSEIQKQWDIDRGLSEFRKIPHHPNYESNGYGVVRTVDTKAPIKVRRAEGGQFAMVLVDGQLQSLYLKDYMDDLFSERKFEDNPVIRRAPKPRVRPAYVPVPRKDVHWFIRDIPGELWEVVEEFPHVEISNHGRLRSVEKPARYYIAQPSSKGEQYQYHIKEAGQQHRQRKRNVGVLVENAFGKRPSGEHILTKERFDVLEAAALKQREAVVLREDA